ncbi:hypothetical protein Tco_1374042 [Tanacetum coccineum]
MEQDSGDNMSYIRSFDPCAYAFVGEENLFKFNGLIDLNATSFRKMIEATVPIVLEWAIGNLNCSVAEATVGYVCQSNSMCVIVAFVKKAMKGIHILLMAAKVQSSGENEI